MHSHFTIPVAMKNIFKVDLFYGLVRCFLMRAKLVTLFRNVTLEVPLGGKSRFDLPAFCSIDFVPPNCAGAS